MSPDSLTLSSPVYRSHWSIDGGFTWFASIHPMPNRWRRFCHWAALGVIWKPA